MLVLLVAGRLLRLVGVGVLLVHFIMAAVFSAQACCGGLPFFRPVLSSRLNSPVLWGSSIFSARACGLQRGVACYRALRAKRDAS